MVTKEGDYDDDDASNDDNDDGRVSGWEISMR